MVFFQRADKLVNVHTLVFSHHLTPVSEINTCQALKATIICLRDGVNKNNIARRMMFQPIRIPEAVAELPFSPI